MSLGNIIGPDADVWCVVLLVYDFDDFFFIYIMIRS